MRVSGPILALDLGRTTGFAIGVPGSAPPHSGSMRLADRDDRIAVAFGALIKFLDDHFRRERPQMVVVEAPLTLGAFLKMGNSEANVQFHFGAHAILHGMCDLWSIKLVPCNNATVRKHFIGKGRLGSREATKSAVVSRCQLLKLIPRDCDDDDRADAVANWDWASATYGKRTSELFLFGEGAA